MEAREEDLDMEPAHRGTFKWIMEPDVNASPPKTSPLIDWLKSNDTLFWLSGKAGSGKSTLMQYIITHHKLSQIFEDTFPDKRRIVTWHYLYERGKDPLQKSREGLLRHLLYHIISQDLSLALPIFKLQKTARSFDHEKVWNWKELKAALEAVLAGLPADVVVLFFIDGLDEYRPIRKLQSLDVEDDADEETSAQLAEVINDGHQEIAELVQSLSKYNNVRLCISSRPLIVFRDNFAGCKSMELHTLTSGDISKYVGDRLAGNELLSQLTILEPTFEDEVKKEILAKADGVFLWVKLVLTVLVRGLKQRDTVEELLQKLRLMPQELGGKNGLYMAMLRNISPENRKDGYAYFQVFQRSEDDLDPLLLSFAMDHEHEVYMVESSPLPAREVSARSWRTADRLVSRCGGLLELRASGSGRGINFIHQTAKEFVMKKSNWEILLGSNQQQEFDGALALQRASVMLLKRSSPCFREGGNGNAGTVWGRLRTSLLYASITEERSRVASAKLILLADRIMFNLCRPEYLCDYTLTDFGTLNVFGIPRGEQPIPTLYDLASHLRSTSPLANVVSPLWPNHWSFLDSSHNPKDKSLISIAVQTNLISFLDIMMEPSMGMSKFFTSDYPLLAHALVPYRLVGTLKDDGGRLGQDQCSAELTSQLLQAGQNPNQIYCGPAYHHRCTAWQGFLVYGDFLFDPYTTSFEATGGVGSRQDYKTWAANALLLILHGADLTVTCAVVDQAHYIKQIEKHYPHRSALFIIVTILWRASRTIGWKKDILEVLMLKGARLRENEKEQLLELAEALKVPQPLVRSVSEIVLEGRASNKTLSDLQTGNGNYLVVTNSSFSRSRSSGIPTPELSGRPSNASSEMRPRSESLGISANGGHKSPRSKWARRQKEAKKRLKAFFGHGHD